MKDQYEQLTLWSQEVLDDLVVPVVEGSTPIEANQTKPEGELAYIQLSLPEMEVN